MKAAAAPLPKPLTFVAIIISSCLLLQIFLSFPLWQAERPFPFLPLYSLIALDSFFFFGLIAGLIGILSFSSRRAGYALALLSLVFLISNDLNRLQIWIYLFGGMLAILASGPWLSNEMKRIGLQWMIGMLYCWGGLHKLNIYFVEDIFPWLLEPLIAISMAPAIPIAGYAAALFECLIGLIFLSGKYGKIGFYLSLSFHLSLLFFLGPFMHDWNRVVWPWNVAMILINYFLFYQSVATSLRDRFVKFRQFPIFAAILLLYSVLPAFNRAGYWDEQLSFKMYSGTQKEGLFYFANDDEACFPPEAKVGKRQGRKQVILDEWAFNVLKTPLYSSERTLKRIGREYCACIQDPMNAGLEIIVAGYWSKEEQQLLVFPCGELLKNP